VFHEFLRDQAAQISNARALERSDVAPSDIFSVFQDRVAPTLLELLRTDAEDDDRLEIVAEVRSEPAEDPIHEERRSIAVRASGIRVATLGCSSGTSVEMGAGVNVHLLSDLAFVGYGWNVTEKESPSFRLMGIGLFEPLGVVR